VSTGAGVLALGVATLVVFVVLAILAKGNSVKPSDQATLVYPSDSFNVLYPRRML